MGPYKCPGCGVWWAGLEHRCRTTELPSTTTVGDQIICTCAQTAPSPNVSVSSWSYKPCPLHPVRVWY